MGLLFFICTILRMNWILKFYQMAIVAVTSYKLQLVLIVLWLQISNPLWDSIEGHPIYKPQWISAMHRPIQSFFFQSSQNVGFYMHLLLTELFSELYFLWVLKNKLTTRKKRDMDSNLIKRKCNKALNKSRI